MLYQVLLKENSRNILTTWQRKQHCTINSTLPQRYFEKNCVCHTAGRRFYTGVKFGRILGKAKSIFLKSVR